MTQFKFIVDLDIESPQSDHALCREIAKAVSTALSKKKLKRGKVNVHVLTVSDVQSAALNLVSLLERKIVFEADTAAENAIDSYDQRNKDR